MSQEPPLKNYSSEVLTLSRVLFSKEYADKEGSHQNDGAMFLPSNKASPIEAGEAWGAAGSEWGNRREAWWNLSVLAVPSSGISLICCWFHDRAGFSCSSWLFFDQEW